MKWVPVIVFTLLLAAWFAPRLPHDLRLRSLEQEYASLKHPASEPLAFEAELGLYGNGNHCDYFVGELRRTALPMADVRRAYEGTKVEVRLPDEVREWTEIAPLRRLCTRASPGTYVVFLLDQERPGGDFRCH